MKHQMRLQQLTFLAVCIALSLVSKRIVSPITNIITDFIRIPGGGASTAFSLMFLVVGCTYISYPFAGIMASMVQGFLALCLGMSGYQGIFILFTYTIPGLAIDLIRAIIPARNELYFCVTCCISNTVCAVCSNLLVFHLRSVALLLWILVAATFGFTAGLLGGMIHKKLSAVCQVWRREYA